MKTIQKTFRTTKLPMKQRETVNTLANDHNLTVICTRVAEAALKFREDYVPAKRNVEIEKLG